MESNYHKIITLGSIIMQTVALRDLFKYFCLHLNISAIMLSDLLGGDFKIMIDYSRVTSLWKSVWEFPLLLCGVCTFFCI